MPAPRPILKGLPSASAFVSSETETASNNPFPFSTCPNIFDSPHVHFPPTPTLTSTEITHSSFTYDRAPIVVTPNICALPERGGRKLFTTGSTRSNSNSNQGGGGGGGLGYFHPHAKFQVNAVRAADSVETVVPPPPTTIFSASVTVGNINECGSVELFMKKKRSGPMHDYDYDHNHDYGYDQYSSHVSSLLFDRSSDSSNLGVFYTPPLSIPTPSSSSSSSSSSSIPHSSLSVSPRNTYDTSTATSSLTTAGSSSTTTTTNNNNNNTAGHSDKYQKTSVDVGRNRKKRGRNKVEEGLCRTKKWTMSRLAGGGGTSSDDYSSSSSPEIELEGCLGGF